MSVLIRDLLCNRYLLQYILMLLLLKVSLSLDLHMCHLKMMLVKALLLLLVLHDYIQAELIQNVQKL